MVGLVPITFTISHTAASVGPDSSEPTVRPVSRYHLHNTFIRIGCRKVVHTLVKLLREIKKKLESKK